MGFVVVGASLYKHRRITMGKNLCVWEMPFVFRERTANMVCTIITQCGFSLQ